MKPKFGFKKRLKGDQSLIEDFSPCSKRTNLISLYPLGVVRNGRRKPEIFSVWFAGFPSTFDQWFNSGTRG